MLDIARARLIGTFNAGSFNPTATGGWFKGSTIEVNLGDKSKKIPVSIFSRAAESYKDLDGGKVISEILLEFSPGGNGLFTDAAVKFLLPSFAESQDISEFEVSGTVQSIKRDKNYAIVKLVSTVETYDKRNRTRDIGEKEFSIFFGRDFSANIEGLEEGDRILVQGQLTVSDKGYLDFQGQNAAKLLQPEVPALDI